MTPEERAEAIHPCKHGLGGYDGQCNECIADAIRAAVAEQQEQDARIADALNKPVPYTSPSYDEDCGRSEAAREIAAAIRAGEKS